jgi:hypothetical protein
VLTQQKLKKLVRIASPLALVIVISFYLIKVSVTLTKE